MKKTSHKTVVVGMSGGVDSSVTAALLKEQGFGVIGVFMKNWSASSYSKGSLTSRDESEDFGSYGCTWAEDAEDARKVAQQLDIPFYVWNFEKEYYDKVVEYFLNEYAANRTPNPDVMCNSEIKFKLFLEKALSLGADFVATGHYARIRYQESDNSYQLLKGIDPSKDQSYFLYTLKQRQLSKILFPIGDMKKSQVRELALNYKLPNAAKKDSQGICFIGKINVREFLMDKIKAQAGQIVTTTGQAVGQHTGLPFYTVGQRQGIGLGGTGPYYVVNKKLIENILVVTNNKDDKELWKHKFTVADLSWTNKQPNFPLKSSVTIRYHHPEYSANIEQITDIRYQITFDQPQRAITSGQAAVFYEGDELLGGGVIDNVT